MRWIVYFLAIFGFAAPLNAVTPNSLPRITSERQFDQLARTVEIGRYASFPQVMFVIDRRVAKSPRTYFINTKRFLYHVEFIQKSYLSTQSVNELLDASYADPNRRFIVGSVVHYQKLDRYGVEFWEGDILTRKIVDTAFATLGPLFPKPLVFKPNSQPQIDLAASIPGLATIDSNAIYGARDSLVLNPGKAVGTLRILPRIADSTVVRRGEIIILDEAPLRMNPVAGIITTEFSTPLSHVNLLAKSWRIPNGFVRGAAQKYAGLAGKIVAMNAGENGITLRLATPVEIAAAQVRVAGQAVHLAAADLTYRALPSLSEQRARDILRTGAKAANLGEVVAKMGSDAKAGFSVPAGFSIPFAYYDDFVQANGLDKQIDALLADKAALADPVIRRAKLETLRAAFVAAPFDPSLLANIAARRDAVIGNVGVFARSSTNSEDLPGFNGAGLYSSVPNVLGDAALAKAVKTVWASVWNEAAFDARVAAAIDHRSVMASVLVQRGMNADSAGVMITENPFDPAEVGAIFINAKRGLGIRVVEGRKVAEQLLYRPDPESIQVLTRSTDDAKLVFDAQGGVRELPVEPGRLVLTDLIARRLARAATRIDAMFGGKAQDIEWLMIGETIYIVQSRPYLRGN